MREGAPASHVQQLLRRAPIGDDTAIPATGPCVGDPVALQLVIRGRHVRWVKQLKSGGGR